MSTCSHPKKIKPDNSCQVQSMPIRIYYEKDSLQAIISGLNACVDRYLKHLEYWKIVLMIPLIQKKISQLIHENQHVKITTSKRQGSFLLGAAQTSLSTLKSNRLSDRLFTCTNGLPQISSARVEIPKIRCMESIYARDLQQNIIPQIPCTLKPTNFFFEILSKIDRITK